MSDHGVKGRNVKCVCIELHGSEGHHHLDGAAIEQGARHVVNGELRGLGGLVLDKRKPLPGQPVAWWTWRSMDTTGEQQAQKLENR